MAIKSISQLDEFDNTIQSHSPTEGNSFAIGERLAFASEDLLTYADKMCQKADGIPDSTIAGTNEFGKYDSLLEISETSNFGDKNDETTYHSKKITYRSLAQNVIWDVKAYLNWRNNLSDYNLSRIVDGDQEFHGKKSFNGDIYLNGGLTSTTSISALGNGYFSNAYVKNDITATNIKASNDIQASQLSVASYLSTPNAYITNLSNQIAFTSSLTVQNELSLGWFDQIKTSNPEMFICAWAYGLKDSANQKTNFPPCETQNDINHETSSTSVGDPVWFYNGRPSRISAVNMAISATTLINRDGTGANVGKGKIISINGITDTNNIVSSEYKAVYLSAGQLCATNVIDYAMHAFWSDLGEKYLADSNYEPGTLVKFGGKKEITIADDEVNAIVSTKAFDLNAGLSGGITIALCGRVPTKVKGKIQKFDKVMLSDIPGVACKWDGKRLAIGKALESNENEEIKLVECVTRFII